MFILELSILLFAALIAGILIKRVGYPAALGEMLVGIAVGPFALGLVGYSEFLTLFSELGAIILLFYIGLETDIDALKRNSLPSLVVGTAGAILPLALGYWSAILLGLDQTESLFIGAILMATSIGISIRLLRDIGKLASKEGVVILGAGIVDDVIAVIFLSVVLDAARGSFEPLDTVSITARALIFWFTLVILGIRFFPKILRSLALKHEELSLTLLAMAFLFSYAANQVGLSAIIGAFAVGVALSKFEKLKDISHFFDALFLFFVPIFFVSIGLRIDIQAFSTSLVPGLVLTAVAVLSKITACTAGAVLTGLSGHKALRIGVGMMPRGEMGLIIAGAGLSSGFIGQNAYFSSIIVVLLTTFIALPLLKKMFGNHQPTSNNSASYKEFKNNSSS